MRLLATLIALPVLGSLGLHGQSSGDPDNCIAFGAQRAKIRAAGKNAPSTSAAGDLTLQVSGRLPAYDDNFVPGTDGKNRISTFGTVNSARDARIVQLGLRLIF